MLNSAKDIKISSKWYFNAVILVIIVLGFAGARLQYTLPNQEIVLQFTNQDISIDDAQRTVAVLEDQLLRIGASDIHVSEQEEGKLIITYYSNTTVGSIKKLLSKQKELALGLASNPDREPIKNSGDGDTFAYNFNVYEIHSGQQALSDMGGKCGVELKTGSFRFLNPHFYISSFEDISLRLLETYPTERQFHYFSCFIQLNNAHKIPEVRAGPFS